MRFPDDVPVLTDGVVTLRAHRAGDVDEVLEQCADPLSQRWTTVPIPYHREDAEHFVGPSAAEGWADGRWMFAVEAADEAGRPRFCGTVELRDEGNRRAEIAFGSHPWARGRGIVEPALRLLLEWGFTEQRLRVVSWWANVGNWASRRTAWKLGFSHDGTVERWLAHRGDLADGWFGVLHVDDERSPRGEWLQVPRIDGDGIVLRAYRHDDAPRVAQACGDERTQYWFDRMPSPYTLEDAHAYIETRSEQLATAGGLTWVVADGEDDRLLASISAFDLKARRDAEIGYWAHPEARGRGVMTQACGLVVRHCLTPYDAGGLGLQRVAISHAVGNTASQHVIEANGFTRVGQPRRTLRMRDETLVDQVDYDLLLEEFEARSR